jgi:hypothetical protein
MRLFLRRRLATVIVACSWVIGRWREDRYELMVKVVLKRQIASDQVKAGLRLDLLASDRAYGGEVVVVEVVVVFVRVATSAWHRLGGQTVVVEEGRRGRGDLGVGTASPRRGHVGINARHTEAIRSREGGGKAVAVTVLGRGRGLAVRRLLSVAEIG